MSLSDALAAQATRGTTGQTSCPPLISVMFQAQPFPRWCGRHTSPRSHGKYSCRQPSTHELRAQAVGHDAWSSAASLSRLATQMGAALSPLLAPSSMSASAVELPPVADAADGKRPTACWSESWSSMTRHVDGSRPVYPSDRSHTPRALTWRGGPDSVTNDGLSPLCDMTGTRKDFRGSTLSVSSLGRSRRITSRRRPIVAGDTTSFGSSSRATLNVDASIRLRHTFNRTSDAASSTSPPTAPLGNGCALTATSGDDAMRTSIKGSMAPTSRKTMAVAEGTAGFSAGRSPPPPATWGWRSSMTRRRRFNSRTAGDRLCVPRQSERGRSTVHTTSMRESASRCTENRLGSPPVPASDEAQVSTFRAWASWIALQ